VDTAQPEMNSTVTTATIRESAMPCSCYCKEQASIPAQLRRQPANLRKLCQPKRELIASQAR
jgi:hypothetical protein